MKHRTLTMILLFFANVISHYLFFDFIVQEKPTNILEWLNEIIYILSAYGLIYRIYSDFWEVHIRKLITGAALWASLFAFFLCSAHAITYFNRSNMWWGNSGTINLGMAINYTCALFFLMLYSREMNRTIIR